MKMSRMDAMSPPSTTLADLQNSITQDVEKKGSATTIYSTNKINEIIDSIASGSPKVDYKPFYKKNPELRSPNILFEMTEWESAEFDRCMLDANYFTENYAKFKTDYGYRLVELRDYQREAVELVTSEVYDEEMDLCVPENRNVILMQSRQTGKCVTYDTKVMPLWDDGDQEIGEIYHKFRKKTFLDKVRDVLMWFYKRL